jgi:ferredoxin
MGVEPSRVLQESFGGGVSGEKHTALDTGSLILKLSRSGLAVNISSDETVLEGAEKNGVLLPSGCRQGNCGTCATKLVSGNVQVEAAEVLNDEMRSQGFILPCVSRALSDITLDA